MRKRIRKVRKDKRVFRQTADKTQVVNIKTPVMRGGIRL